MIKWIAKNWLPILASLIVITGVCRHINILINNKQYKADIEDKNIEIAKGERKVEIINGINSDLMDERKEAKATSDKKIADMKKNQKRKLARISSERDEWKAKVKEMPASTVVIKIRTILKTGEIWERPDGILFSLVAARDCLAVLGDFSLVKERDQWRDDYNIALNRIDDLNGIIATDEEIFYNFDDICFTKDEIIDEEREKFSLSEKRNRQIWWRGLKAGAPIGGGIVALLWLVLGK